MANHLKCSECWVIFHTHQGWVKIHLFLSENQHFLLGNRAQNHTLTLVPHSYLPETSPITPRITHISMLSSRGLNLRFWAGAHCSDMRHRGEARPVTWNVVLWLFCQAKPAGVQWGGAECRVLIHFSTLLLSEMKGGYTLPNIPNSFFLLQHMSQSL